MAAIAQIRDEAEARLGRKFRQLNARHRRRITDALKRHGSVEQIPAAFWEELRREIESEIALFFGAVFLGVLASTDARWEQFGVGFAADQRARESALDRFQAARAREVAAGSVEHTRGRLVAAERKLVARGVEDFRKRLQQDAIPTIISSSRAEAVAVTETTATISAAQQHGAGEFKAQFPELVLLEIWVTERDNRVCPICQPLDNKQKEVWGREFPKGPPAHPLCRCELKFEITKGSLAQSPRKGQFDF